MSSSITRLLVHEAFTRAKEWMARIRLMLLKNLLKIPLCLVLSRRCKLKTSVKIDSFRARFSPLSFQACNA